jgi:hypothetical protein
MSVGEKSIETTPKRIITKYESSGFDSLRKTLIDQYHSQILTHVGYVLALLVGTLTIISRWDSFFGKGSILENIFFLIISCMAGLGLFFIGRLWYWSYLSSGVLSITESKFEEYNELDNQNHSCLFNLQKCIISDLKTAPFKGNDRYQLIFARYSTKELIVYSFIFTLIVFATLLVLFNFL